MHADFTDFFFYIHSTTSAFPVFTASTLPLLHYPPRYLIACNCCYYFTKPAWSPPVLPVFWCGCVRHFRLAMLQSGWVVQLADGELITTWTLVWRLKQRLWRVLAGYIQSLSRETSVVVVSLDHSTDSGTDLVFYCCLDSYAAVTSYGHARGSP